MLQQQWALMCDVMWRLTHPALAIIAPSECCKRFVIEERSTKSSEFVLCVVLFFRVLSFCTSHSSHLLLCAAVCLALGWSNWLESWSRCARKRQNTAREAKQWCKVMRKITFTNLSIKVLLVQLQLRSEKLLHASTLAGFLWLFQSCCVYVKKRAEILPQHTQ